MKRSIIVLALVLILAGGLGGLAVAEEQAAPATYQGFPVVNVVIGGQDTGLSGILIDGVTYGPVRSIVEALGGRIKWDPETKTANVEKPAAVTAEAKPTTEETIAPAGDGVSIMATPEEIAAARATYNAAVAAADAARAVANNAAYLQYSKPGLPGHFDLEVYNSLYLPALAEIEATRDQAIAAAAAAYFAATGEQP